MSCSQQSVADKNKNKITATKQSSINGQYAINYFIIFGNDSFEKV